MPPKRQTELAELITRAAITPEIRDAMAVFKMGDEEYAKAIAAMTTVTFTSGASTTLLGDTNANVDSNKERNR